jgi:hypothetical protein
MEPPGSDETVVISWEISRLIIFSEGLLLGSDPDGIDPYLVARDRKGTALI